MENFEKAYIDSTEAFYKLKAPQYLEINGVQNYMRYAESKLREEEQRANKYLESCSIATVSYLKCLGLVDQVLNLVHNFSSMDAVSMFLLQPLKKQF